MKKQLISIIVPVYKAESYISRCIESVLSQTYSEWELLLINDGSLDHSGEICKRYAKRDDRIRYYEQKNQGVSVARNLGIKKAKGEIITFLDADDWVVKEMCEMIIEYWDESLELLIFDYEEVHSDGKKIYRHFFQKKQIDFRSDPKYDIDFFTLSCLGFYKEWDKDALPLWIPWGRAYARRFLESNTLRFPKGIFFSEDCIFNLRCAVNLNYVKYISTSVYYYYMNDQSVTHTVYKNNIIDLLKNYNKLYKEIKKIIGVKEDNRYMDAFKQFIVTTLTYTLWMKPKEEDPIKRKKYYDFCRKYMEIVCSYGLNSFSLKEKMFILCCKYRLFFIIRLYVYLKQMISIYLTKLIQQ